MQCPVAVGTNAKHGKNFKSQGCLLKQKRFSHEKGVFD